MCYLWTNKEEVSQYPSFDEWRTMIDRLEVWAEKPFTIIFGGGEPLLYKEKVAALIHYAHTKGFRTSLATSGYYLDKETVLKLRNAGLDYIALTLYSLNPKTQDFLRGVKGSLRRVKKAIRYLNQYAPAVEIAIDTVLMEPNREEIVALTRWVQKHKSISKISFQVVMQPFHTPPCDTWYTEKKYAFLWPQSIPTMIDVIDSLQAMKRSEESRGEHTIQNDVHQFDIFKKYFEAPETFIKHQGCPMFNNGHFGVAPDGSITLCPYMEPIGNIKDAMISDIWNSQCAEKRRAEIQRCTRNCHQIMNCWYEDESELSLCASEKNVNEKREAPGVPEQKDTHSIESTSCVSRVAEMISQPQFSDITITTECVLQCKMCKAWHNSGSTPHLELNECKNFVDELREFVTRPLEINVMGGEPLMVPWCLDLCRYISEKGFRSIISTNAYLIDKDMAKRIADSNLSVLAISLESLRPEMHDEMRGKKGTHKRVMQAIEYLDTYCRGKVTMTILSIMMHKNLDDLVPLAEWVEKQPLFENISYLALLETGIIPERHWFKHDYYKEMWPQDKKKFDSVIDELTRMRKAGKKIWNPLSQLDAFKEYYTDPVHFMQTTEYALHDYIIDLDEKKTIYLSGDELGRLGEARLKDMWQSERAQALREKIKTHGPGKRSCVINFVCAFPDDKTYTEKKKSELILRTPSVYENECSPSKKEINSISAETVRTPKFSVIMVNQACPLRCKMCYNWKEEVTRKENTLSDMKRFVSQCAELVGSKFEINLAGGEPFLRHDIFQLIRHISDLGYTVSCTSNGFLLNDHLLGQVRQSGLHHMPISLDSLNPEIHDDMRGRAGTQKQVMNVFEKLWKDRGCLKSLTIQTIIMKPNLDGIVNLVKWAHEHDISTYLMAIMRPVGIAIDPLWYKKKEYTFLWPDDLKKVYDVIDALIAMKDEGYRIENKREQLYAFKEYFKNPTVFVKNGPCSLGDGILNVGPDGNIYLCWEKGPIGNIQYDDVRKLWYSRGASERRKEILGCRRNCAEMVNCFFEE
jgi:MoaA/NifB/PqqE/SkfB family radical SAM enzyme